jgi:hypothetical protein
LAVAARLGGGVLMPSSTISNHVSPGITLRAPAYYSPLTITATGSVDSGASPSAIYGPIAGAAITNYGTVSSAAGNGINLAAGGIVTNAVSGTAVGTITGYSGGVLMEGAGGTTGITGTVTNAGTIASTGTGFFTRAISFYAGGLVTNTGVINSHWSGVTFNFLNTTAGGVGTVNNSGTIAVTTVGTITGGDAVGFESAIGEDGTLINRGLISQTGRGNAVGGAHGTVSNYGTIFETSSYFFAAIDFDRGSPGNGGVVTNFSSIIAQGAASNGIDLYAGSVTNHDLIEGSDEGVLFTGGPGTVVNYGTITGYGGLAVSFTGGGNLLKIEPGAVFGGTVAGGAAGAANTLELASSGTAGTISGIGSQFLNFKSVYVDAGATWLLSGSNTIGSGVNLTVGTGGTLSLTGSFTNLGTVTPSFIFNAQNVTLFNSGVIAAGGAYFTLTGTNYIDNLSGGSFQQVVRALSGGGPSTIVNSGSIFSVTLDSGGAVTNGAGGATGALIQNGINAGYVAATIVNSGTVSGSGLGLTAGGTVTNGQSGSTAGLISASLESAVRVSGGAATITNYGTIGNTTTSPGEGGTYAGIVLSGGGSITNAQGGATIFGYDDGVLATTTPATVTNFGNIHSTGTGTAGAGVALAGGGAVVNKAGGLISATGTGIVGTDCGISIGYGTAHSTAFGGVGTVENYGIVSGSGGVYLHDGGAVINAAGALISSSHTGAIYAAHTPTTVFNAGTILAGSTNTYGIYLFAGGAVTNVAGALISGGVTGVKFDYPYPGQLLNQGTIVGNNYRGVDLGGAGTIINAAGAVISGLREGVYLNGSAGTATTLINAGTITGAGGIAVAFYGNNNRLIVDPGAVFGGVVNGGTSGGLELAAGTGAGTLSGLGSNYVSFSTVTVDPGADWQLAGTNAIGAGTTFSDLGSLTNTGALSVGGALIYSGTLVNSGTITVAGTATFEDPGATLINGGSINGTVTLTGGGYLDNTTTGFITSYGTAVLGVNTLNTVTNAGTITGTGTAGVAIDLASGGTVVNSGAISGVYGIRLKGGGTVINQAGATIAGTTGAGYGVHISYSSYASTVVNSGTIVGALGVRTYGSVTLTNAGTITGTGSNGGGEGVLAGGGSVNNTGVIKSSYYTGVDLNAGGFVTNALTGSISGSYGVAVLNGAGTVSNGGTIVGNTLDGVLFDGGYGAVSNHGVITAAKGIGVDLQGGGYVANGLTGSISSPNYAIFGSGTALSVLNLGTISTTAPDTSSGIRAAIRSVSGGIITNAASGLITGADGVQLDSGGTVTNLGNILATGSFGAGVFDEASGVALTVVNGAAGNSTATTTGAVGVEDTLSPLTVVNYGTISAAVTAGSDIGVHFFAGGRLDNKAGATIAAGNNGILDAGVLADGGGTTITNAGTIVGGGGTAVAFSGYNNRLIIDPGAVFGGVVNGGTAGVLELAAGVGSGTLGLGSNFVNFSNVAVDSGASWQLTGSGVGSAFTNSGTVIVPSGGNLSLGPVGGSGAIDVLSNGVVVFGGTVGAGQTVSLAAAGKIDLTDFSGQYLQGFSATIAGLAASGSTTPVNEVELAGVPFSGAIGAVLSGNTITVTNGGTAVAALTLASAPGPGVIVDDRADAGGGTDLFLTTAPTIAINQPLAENNVLDADTVASGFAISGTTTSVEDGRTVTVRILNSSAAIHDTLTTSVSGGLWSVNVTPAQAQGLVQGSYTVTADVSDVAGNPAPGASQAITVNPAAEPASLAGTVQTVSGGENSGIPLTIVATPADSDDVLWINISGVPSGATLNAGTLNADGSYTLTPAQLTGLTLNAGESGGTLNVVLTSSEGSSSIGSSARIAVNVTPVAEAPSLAGTVLTASGSETSAIPLTIVGTSADSDDVLSINISAVPAGATLSAGTLNANGSYTLTPAQLSGLTLNAGESGGTLNVVVTSSEGSSSVGSSASIAVNVTPVAEAPSLAGTVQTVSGGENSGIPLTIVATPADSDDVLSINISGVPSGATLSAGTLNANGSYTLTPAQLTGLTLNAGESGGTLNVVVTSSEGSSSVGSSASIGVNVSPVAEAPNLAGTVLTVSGDENSAIPLTIVTTPADSDDVLSINISGVPAGARLSAGTLNADGSYTLTPAQLPGLTYNCGTAGAVLHVVAANTEGSSTATASVNVAVSINVAVSNSALFDFVYTYPDGKDYYEGTVADNGTFGYHTGGVINLSGGGEYQITGQEPGTTSAPAGAVFVTYYSHGGIGQASPEPQQTAAGQADGTSGLGSEADRLLGTDGQSHFFSPTVEASFTANQQYGFVYDYADGSAYYTGTVSDNGSFGYAAVAASATPFIFPVNPSTGAVAGHYKVFAEGQTSGPSGTVRLQSYVDGVSGSTFSMGGTVGGTSGLGNEAGGLFIGSSFFTFSDTHELVDPPPVVTPGGSPPPPAMAPGTAAFDGDPDLIWQSSGGEVDWWSMQRTVPSGMHVFVYVGPGWRPVGAAGLGDGGFDFLWQADSGEVDWWTMQGTAISGMHVLANPGPGWRLVGSANLGDGSSDLLWQAAGGEADWWTMQGTAVSGMDVLADPGPGWRLVGSANLGDGSSDLLWQSNSGEADWWTLQGTAVTGMHVLANPGPGWSLLGAQNFGDGSADLLWQSSSGEVDYWTLQGTAVTGMHVLANPGPNWHPVG